MRASTLRWVWLLAASAGALHCGGDGSSALLVEQHSDERVAGRFEAEGRSIEFSSERSAPLVGDVSVGAPGLTYDVHFDYEGNGLDGREVVADGHGGQIDRATQRALGEALEALKQHLGPSRAGSAMQEQMLLAGLSLLRDSGGMPLARRSFALGPKGLPVAQGAEVDKSLGDDGVDCIKSGETYLVSFDFGDTTVSDLPVEAGIANCNGQCGPGCTQLQPWRMWTLDCLEHDTCCNATDDNNCWTPLGECGDEYDAAEADFLRGYDPFGKHCGG